MKVITGCGDRGRLPRAGVERRDENIKRNEDGERDNHDDRDTDLTKGDKVGLETERREEETRDCGTCIVNERPTQVVTDDPVRDVFLSHVVHSVLVLWLGVRPVPLRWES